MELILCHISRLTTTTFYNDHHSQWNFVSKRNEPLVSGYNAKKPALTNLFKYIYTKTFKTLPEWASIWFVLQYNINWAQPRQEQRKTDSKHNFDVQTSNNSYGNQCGKSAYSIDWRFGVKFWLLPSLFLNLHSGPHPRLDAPKGQGTLNHDPCSACSEPSSWRNRIYEPAAYYSFTFIFKKFTREF